MKSCLADEFKEVVAIFLPSSILASSDVVRKALVILQSDFQVFGLAPANDAANIAAAINGGNRDPIEVHGLGLDLERERILKEIVQAGRFQRAHVSNLASAKFGCRYLGYRGKARLALHRGFIGLLRKSEQTSSNIARRLRGEGSRKRQKPLPLSRQPFVRRLAMFDRTTFLDHKERVLSQLGLNADVSNLFSQRRPTFVVLFSAADCGVIVDLVWSAQEHGVSTFQASLQQEDIDEEAVVVFAPTFVGVGDPAQELRLGGENGLRPASIVNLGSAIDNSTGWLAGFATICRDRLASAGLKLRKRSDRKRPTNGPQHQYSADHVARLYVGVGDQNALVPGFWMHGWLPSRFNNHVGLLAQHKKHGMETTLSPADLRRQQETEPQWVAREDQARFLRENGYAKVEAIGLPFVYLPDVDIARRPGSLLVLPPHGRARHKAGDAFADSYADAVFALKPHFETIVACVTERDLARDEWRPQFAARGIPVVKGSDHSDPGTLLRMKRLFSSFDFATTNAFGSAIAYAAHCGVKVSVHGPYADWDVMQATHATILYPELPTLIAALYSEAALRASQEALFVNPWEALERKSWADSEIGTQHRKSPAELGRLFGWKA